MNALSLWEPWASLVAEQFKYVETRSWSTPIRGWVAIHAARHFTGDLLDFTRYTPEIRERLSGPREWGTQSPLVRDAFTDTRGRMIALARLVDCVPTTAVRFGWFEYGRPERVEGQWRCAPSEVRYGDYTAGRWAWIFNEVIAIPPELRPRVSGQRGLFQWEPPAAVAALMLAAH